MSVWFTAVDPPTPNAATASDSHPDSSTHASAALIAAAPADLASRPFHRLLLPCYLRRFGSYARSMPFGKRMIAGDKSKALPLELSCKPDSNRGSKGQVLGKTDRYVVSSPQATDGAANGPKLSPSRRRNASIASGIHIFPQRLFGLNNDFGRGRTVVKEAAVLRDHAPCAWSFC